MNTKDIIYFEDVVNSYEFNNLSKDSFILGKVINTNFNFEEDTNKYKTLSLKQNVNFLISGITGTGKSVILHNLILSLMLKNSPKDLKFILCDLKMVEFNEYKGLPYLLKDPIKNPRDVIESLNELNEEIVTRLEKLESKDCYTLKDYNKCVQDDEKLPEIVLVIDEYQDMQYIAEFEFENLILSLVQRGRAVGIHIVMSSQKTHNDFRLQTILALKTISPDDSYYLLGQTGAEKLDFHGELLVKDPFSNELTKVQSVYVSNKDINKIVEELKNKIY